jgi:hypothetical protein
MTKSKETCAPSDVAEQIHRRFRTGGSAERAKAMQWFFKEEVKSIRLVHSNIAKGGPQMAA